MKKAIIFSAFIFMNISSFSQTFQHLHADSIKGQVFAGAMVDSKGAGLKNYYFTANDSLFYFDLKDGKIKDIAVEIDKFNEIEFADVSKNGFLDLIFSSEQGTGYIQNVEGKISSLPYWKNNFALQQLKVIDLDLNGTYELIGLNNQRLILHSLGKDSVVLSDSNLQGFHLMDYDNQNGQDIIIIEENGLSKVLLHEDRLKFTAGDTLGYFQKLTSFDFDGTGISDLLVLNNDGELYLKQDTSVIELDSLGFAKIKTFDIIDLNSDGQPDISIAGKRKGRSVISLLLSDSSTFVLEELNFDTSTVGSITFGDIEADGDLDLVVASESLGNSFLNFYLNTTQSTNRAPNFASNATAFPTLNGVYLFFDSAHDDHSPIASLSYDLLCFKNNNETLISSYFQLPDFQRLINRTGNIGRKTKVYLPDLDPGSYTYFIQGIDNSLHSLKGSGICRGSFEYCENLTMEELSACKGESILLEADSTTKGRWFSANRRSLIGTEEPSLRYTPTVSDTIYYASTEAEKCEDYRIWRITVKPPMPDYAYDTTACLGDKIMFNYEEVDSLEFHTFSENIYGTEKLINYPVHYSLDTLAFKFYQNGCRSYDTILVRGQKPELTVNRDYFLISPGETAILEAYGAIKYQWSPIIGLSNPYHYRTEASPVVSTRYEVIGYDYLNCQDTAVIKVNVNLKSNIPNLFTPNNDGSNDRLRIIGLKDISSFDFIVYDRYGKIIYRSQNAEEVTLDGWDGTFNGALQPDGIYYWSINGSYNSGHQVLLNGRAKGEVVLKR